MRFTECSLVPRKRPVVAAVLALGLMAVAACSSNSSSHAAVQPTAKSTSGIPALHEDATLHALLPATNKARGTLIFDTVPNPPWAIVGTNGQVDSGVDIDLGNALAQLLGLKLQTVLVGDASTLLAGISAGRYDTFLGPLGVTTAREKTLYELVWVANQFYFEVSKSSNISTVVGLCGQKVAVLTGTIGIPIVSAASKDDCVNKGMKAMTLVSFATDPEAELAVESGRVQGYALANATCYYETSQPAAKSLTCVVPTSTDNIPIEPAALAVSNKNPMLLNALKMALREMYKLGVYQKILAKWGLQRDGETSQFLQG